MSDWDIEYDVRHKSSNDVEGHTFESLTEMIEWVSRREEPEEWRLYERRVTDWIEVE